MVLESERKLGVEPPLTASHGEDQRPSLRSGPSLPGKAALLQPQTLSGVFGKPRPPGPNSPQPTGEDTGGQRTAPDHSE